MAVTISIRCFTGTGAGTESAAQTAIALLSVDAATDDPNSHQVTHGTNSFEKWVAVSIDTADGGSFTNFWVEVSGALPTGVVIKMGVTDTPATPTSATSLVATTTMVAGRRYTFDANTYTTNGSKSRYLVLQEQVASTAAAGVIPQQKFTIGYAQN